PPRSTLFPYTTLFRSVTWTNGDSFNADDVVFNFTRWCDRSAEGNSMPGRLGTLVDDATGKLREGAVTKVDDRTVKLSLLKSDITDRKSTRLNSSHVKI